MTNTRFAEVSLDEEFKPDTDPQLVKLMHAEFTDATLASPTPSVLLGLASCSTSLYDLGVSSGLDFGRKFKHASPANRTELTSHRDHMYECLNAKRPHLFRAYAEGWINGFYATTNGVIA